MRHFFLFCALIWRPMKYDKISVSHENGAKNPNFEFFSFLCRIVNGQNFYPYAAPECTKRSVEVVKSSKFSALKGGEWQNRSPVKDTLAGNCRLG